MDPYDLSLQLQILIGFCTLIGLMYGFARWVWPRLKSAAAWWAKLVKGLMVAPSVLDAILSISAIKAQLDLITKQVMPNGGSSMPDSMKRIEATLEGNKIYAENIGKTVNLMAATLRAASNTNPHVGTFEADTHGLLTDANKTYLQWCGKQLTEVVRWGWINTVHPDDRERVRAEWRQAIEEVRTSTMRYRIVDEDGKTFLVDTTATPIPEGIAPCEKWVGVVYLVEGHR